MADPSHEQHFQDLLAKGMATPEEVAEARRLLDEAAAQGRTLSLSEALMRAGAKAARAHHESEKVSGTLRLKVPDTFSDPAQAAESAATAAAQSSDLQMIEKIGRGSQAVVYKCRQISMDRIVAVKFLHPQAAGNAETRQRFIQEARHAAQLMHPNIVTIHQIAPLRDTLYIVMEYVDGGSVAELLAARKRFDPIEATCIIRAAAEGLACAHKRGVIHRDIKPGNILLTQGGIVKLADLGLALSVGAVADAVQAGKAYGTPYYISPEQVRGDVDIDLRTDLYSLGATFYEMVAGVPPFTGPTPQDILRKHLTEPVPDPRERVPDLPPALCRLLTRAMAKDRQHRYESAEDFIAALDKLYPQAVATSAGAAEGGGVAAATAEPAKAGPAPQALVQQMASLSEAERRRPGRAEEIVRKVAADAAKPEGRGHKDRAHGRAALDPRIAAMATRTAASRRNKALVAVFGGLALVAVIVAVVVVVWLYPPWRAPGGPSSSEGPVIPARPPSSSGPEMAGHMLPLPPAPKPFTAAPKPPSPPPPKEEAKAPAPSPPSPAPRPSPEPSSPAPPEPPKEEPKEPPSEPPPPPPPPSAPQAVTVKAADAKIHGANARYEVGPDRDNIGFWSKTDTSVSWDVLLQPATYEVVVTYALDPKSGGGEYAVEIAGRTLKTKPAGTGDWGKFTQKSLGKVKIERAGTVAIVVKPLSVKGGGVMNLQAVTLKPVGP